MTLHMVGGATVTVTEALPAHIPTSGWQALTDSTAGTTVVVNWEQVTHVTP